MICSTFFLIVAILAFQIAQIKAEEDPVSNSFTSELFLNTNDLDMGLYEGKVIGRKLFGGSQVPHGQGTIYYFRNDKFHRQNFTGSWVNGTRHGQGTTIFKDGSRYTGEYRNGVEEGSGILVDTDGNVLEGQFKGGKIDGHGVFKYLNGDQREGFFRDNVLDGQVIYTRSNGHTVIENWVNGIKADRQDQVAEQPSKDEDKDLNPASTDPKTQNLSEETFEKLRSAIRSGDKTFSFSQTKQGRELDPDHETIFRKMRVETEERNSKWLERVFKNVHPNKDK